VQVLNSVEATDPIPVGEQIRDLRKGRGVTLQALEQIRFNRGHILLRQSS